ncbi:hypothetical protein RQP46_000475 [Phenoliferia psychrophenolica]
MVNICASGGIIFSVVAVVLLAFGEIGQINTSVVTRHLRIVSVSTTGFGAAIAASDGAPPDAVKGVYNTGTLASANGTNAGLRMTYEWGLWNYCATNGGLGSSRSYCSKRQFGERFQPAKVLYNDLPVKYQGAFNASVPANVFRDDKYLGAFSMGAQYILFVGAILAALSMIVGLGSHRIAYLAGAIIAGLSFLCLAIGLVIYTIMISRVMKAVNGFKVADVAGGLHFTYGNGLWIMWAATGAIFFAIVPFLIACCTGRSSSIEDEPSKEEEY